MTNTKQPPISSKVGEHFEHLCRVNVNDQHSDRILHVVSTGTKCWLEHVEYNTSQWYNK